VPITGQYQEMMSAARPDLAVNRRTIDRPTGLAAPCALGRPAVQVSASNAAHGRLADTRPPGSLGAMTPARQREGTKISGSMAEHGTCRG